MLSISPTRKYVDIGIINIQGEFYMSRFNDSYLAESVGFNNGHARGLSSGIDMGVEHGYTKGWNEATIQANDVIAGRDQEIDRLSNEIRKGNAYIKDLRAALEKSQRVSELYHTERDDLGIEVRQLRQQIQALQENLQKQVSETEGVFKAFLGAVAIARPALKAVAKMPLHERGQIFYQYGEEAVRLQSQEYVTANRFPHNQPLVQQHLPIANQVFRQTYEQLQTQEINYENNPEDKP